MELAIWVVLTLILWFSLDLPLIYCVAIVAILWVMLKGGGVGNAFSGIAKAIGGTIEFLKRLAVGIPVFVAIMMLVNRMTGISPVQVTRRFQVLGPMPWNWRADIGLPILLFVCLGFLAVGASVKVAQGNWKIAAWIFGGSAITICWMLYLPKTGDAMGRTTMENADKRFAQEGIVAPVVKGAGVLVAGQPEDLRKRGLIGSSYKRAKEYLFGETTPTPESVPAQYVPRTPTVSHPRSGSGIATMQNPLRIYLDPPKMHTRPSGPWCFVFVDDPTLSACDTADGTTIDHEFEKAWWKMPAGMYLVRPYKADEIKFTWY